MYTNNLFDCLALMIDRCTVISHTNGKHASLWWETSTPKQGWLLISSDGDNEQFFLPWEELPDVIKVLFQEGWTWK